MSDNKLDRANLGRKAQRKESYETLISKRKYMLSNSRSRPNKRLKTEFSQNFGLLNNNKENEEDEKVGNRDYITCISHTNSKSSHSDSSQEFEPDLFCNSVTVKESQQELELSSVMTRSATRKCASVGALHYKVDWDQQMKIRKRWPVNVAYNIEGPLVQNSMLRDLLSRSLIEVMSFCKNVWSVNNELQSPEMEEDQSSEWNDSGIYQLVSHMPQGQEEIHESDNDQVCFQSNKFAQENVIISVVLDDEGHKEILYIPQDNDECETITLHSAQTYLIGSEYDLNVSSLNFELNRTSEINENDFHLDPTRIMIGVLNDHNYAQKCDAAPISCSQPENVVILNKEEEKVLKKQEGKEFKLENALNDLLLNTAILKCLVCGQSPQEMISFLDRAQVYYS